MRTLDTVAVSVTDYATRIGRALRAVGGAVVEGEVQRPTTTASGMLFFDLTDGDARVACKVFARDSRRLDHSPRHGDLVQVTIDRPDFYAKQGRVSVIVSDVTLAGEGELLRRREELLARLTAEGLCDPTRRKPLPTFPRAVGVVAGRASDGLADVVRALVDRWPPVHVVTCAALVQGAGAPNDLIDALACMQDHPLVDVVVLARGGGSVQDLVAFDHEGLCRAIWACAKPVVCAVGHTDNVPVCNHVTHSAPTPSRAPELVVPDVRDVRARLAYAGARLAAASDRLGRCSERMAAAAARLGISARLDACRRDVAATSAALAASRRAVLFEREAALRERRAVLAATPRRLPSARSLGSLAAGIDVRARAFFVERESALRSGAGMLAAGSNLLDARRAEVASHGASVARSVRRQDSDHQRDYGRAFARMGRERFQAVARALRGAEHEGERLGELLAAAAERRLRDVARELEHAGELIRARDLRRQGWLLASDACGAPVTDAASIAPGQPLSLRFRDGEADVTTREIRLHEE